MATKCMSLVEQKRLQWAKEKEEMAGMCAPWGPSLNFRDTYRSSIRTQFVSTNQVTLSVDTIDSKVDLSLQKVRRRRSPNLPPIHNNISQEGDDRDGQEEDGEGQTSGYGSDSGGNDAWSQRREQRQDARHNSYPTNVRGYLSPESVVSTPPRLWQYPGGDEANRMRWGDRGVGVGHLWEPTFHEPDCRLPQVQGGGGQLTPGWLERGLNKLNHGSQPMLDRLNYGSQPMLERHIHGSQSMLDRLSHGSQPILERQSHGSQPMLERLNQDSPQVLVIRHPPQSASTDTALSSISNDYERSFIRGQNAPLDPEEMLERERKRQKALEHQNAIRMQVEERERQREEEREKRAQEERLEEERIRRAQEEERKRREQEQRQQKDKETREAQKSQAMKEALEAAERLAKSQKSRASRKHVLHKVGTSEAQKNSELSLDSLELVSDQDVHRAVEEEVLQKTSVPISTDRGHPAPSHTHGGTQTEHVAMPADGLAVMLSSSDTQGVLPNSSGSVQLALLVSPSSVATGLQPPILLSPSAVSENRVMTPSKYRGYGRERSTQTETPNRGERTSLRRYRKKSASLERPPHKGCKLPLRCRSQSQHKVRLEERPKWGVNRPGTQYIKQSEKDPFYQRRMRQRLHKPASPHPGSDNSSRSPSPQSRKNPDQRPVQRRKVQVLEPTKVRVSLNNNARRLRQITLEGEGLRKEMSRQIEEPQPIRQWPVRDILSQLSTLRQGLLLKKKEWQPSRSQTPVSEVSWQS